MADEVALREASDRDRLHALGETGAIEAEIGEFDTIARFAANVCDAPIALINFIDADHQWTKANCGLPGLVTLPRNESFCDQTVRGTSIVEISDTLLDERYAEHPLVLGEPNIRFYAGVPLIAASGHAIGTICVMDRKPKSLSESQRRELTMLAELVVGILSTHLAIPRSLQRRLESLASSVEYVAVPLAILTDVADRSRTSCTYVNRAFLEMFHYAAKEIFDHNVNALFGRETDRGLVERMRKRALEGDPSHAELVLYDREGSSHVVDVHWRAVPAENESATNLVVTFRDLTEQRAVERKLQLQLERMRALYSITRLHDLTGHRQIDSVLELGLRGLDLDFGFVARLDGENITLLNCAGPRRIYDAGAVMPLGETWLRHALEADDVRTFSDISTSAVPTGRERTYPGLGSYVVAPIAIGEATFGAIGFLGPATHAPFDDADREFVRLIGGFVGSALERKQQKERLDTLAFYDALTGLPNRTLLFDRIELATAQAKRDDRIFAVYYLDLDGFKSVNDRAGHAAGDAVLQEVARRLSRVVREGDSVSRLGGDEFVIVASLTLGASDPRPLAARLIATLETPIETIAGPFLVGTSIGIATFPHDGETRRALLAAADDALYRAKTHGKGVAICASPQTSAT